MAPIHDRMPVILEAEQYDSWLDPANQDVEELKHMIGHCGADQITAYPVSPLINSGRAEGPECIDSIELG